MSQDVQPLILQLVVFLIAEQPYALPLAAVERVLPMIAVSPLPQAPPHTLGVINFHHTVVPVLDLRCRFGLPACVYGLTAHLLLARTPRRTLALPVDEVLGVRNVATTAISVPSAVLPGITQIAGMVALADGLLFIYDLDSVLSLEEEQQLTGALEDIGPCT